VAKGIHFIQIRVQTAAIAFSNIALRNASTDLCVNPVFFKRGLPLNHRVLGVAARGSAKTDWNCLERFLLQTKQPQ